MTRQQLLKLLVKYLEGTASREEQDLLLRYYQDCGQDAFWNESELGDPKITEQAIWQGLRDSMDQRRVVALYQRRRWLRAAVAVAAVVALAVAFWWQKETPAANGQAPAVMAVASWPVAQKQAMLTLSDGRVKLLSLDADGPVAADGLYTIRQKGRLLVYTRSPKGGQPPAAAYHMLSLPPGSQYQVQLPDGSKVWLNATSAMRYPLHFAPGKRLVEIQGEAYFEVARDAHRVFQVQPVGVHGTGRGAMVEVLGTHFNVEAYTDEEQIRTTLLEGKVKMTTSNGAGLEAMLSPGEQAVATAKGSLAVTHVDVERVMAWQQGLFYFKGANTREVVQQLARWYGLRASYGQMDEALRFSGKISRRMALADVLKILGQSGLHCTVQGNTIRVGNRV